MWFMFVDVPVRRLFSVLFPWGSEALIFIRSLLTKNKSTKVVSIDLVQTSLENTFQSVSISVGTTNKFRFTHLILLSEINYLSQIWFIIIIIKE